jgi:hypothetical protein
VHLVGPGCNNLLPGGTGGGDFFFAFVADAVSAWGERGVPGKGQLPVRASSGTGFKKILI